MKKSKLILSLVILPLIASCQNNESQFTSFQEYVETVRNQTENDKDIFIFTSSSCPHCQKLSPLVKKYKDEHESESISIHELSVDYTVSFGGAPTFKDKTMGQLTGQSENDCLKALDNRLTRYYNDSQIKGEEMIQGVSGNYLFVYTPLIIWYENNIEVKVVNNVESLLVTDEKGNFTYESFVEMIKFPINKADWNEEFDLTYYKEKK